MNQEDKKSRQRHLDSNIRPIEKGIKTDLESRLTYADYLGLEKLLSAQTPLSDPPHHDEILFIIQHQTSELWMKLIIHELKAAILHIRKDNPGPVSKILSRVKQVQRQLFEQWGVLETLTPSEYAEFRGVLRFASGFQSLQYRMLEFQLGNKNAGMLKVFDHVPKDREKLREILEAPSIYDEFLRFLARNGHAVPTAHIERNWTQPHVRDPGLVPIFKKIRCGPFEAGAGTDVFPGITGGQDRDRTLGSDAWIQKPTPGTRSTAGRDQAEGSLRFNSVAAHCSFPSN